MTTRARARAIAKTKNQSLNQSPIQKARYPVKLLAAGEGSQQPSEQAVLSLAISKPGPQTAPLIQTHLPIL